MGHVNASRKSTYDIPWETLNQQRFAKPSSAYPDVGLGMKEEGGQVTH